MSGNKVLSRESILAMEPGRELDNCIAIDVLGIDTYAFSESGELWNGMKPAPFYSTDISAAWEVVEKSLNGGKRASIYKLPGGTWWGQISDYKAFCETAPEAICKAALLAVMEGGTNQ